MTREWRRRNSGVSSLSPATCRGTHLSTREPCGKAVLSGSRLCVWSLARSLPLWGRSPSRGAHGAAACGAALALLAPAWSCRRARGGVTLGRRSSAAAARSLGAVRSAQRLALSACGRWRGRFLSGGGRRRAALTAPLPAALRWRSWRRLSRAAALAAAWRSAAALPRRRLALSARCVVLSGSRSLRVVVGAVASSLAAVAVARRSRRRCLRRRVGAPGAGFVVPPRSRRRDARPPLFRGGGSLSRRGASCSAARASACGRWRGRFLSGGGRRRAALTAPLPAALRWRSWRRLSRAAALAAA